MKAHGNKAATSLMRCINGAITERLKKAHIINLVRNKKNHKALSAHEIKRAQRQLHVIVIVGLTIITVYIIIIKNITISIINHITKNIIKERGRMRAGGGGGGGGDDDVGGRGGEGGLGGTDWRSLLN